MRTFVQLKDSVGWASINTTEEIPDSIEVEFGTGDFYINKKYENGTWNNADLIKYAVVNQDGEITEIKETYFTTEVSGPKITNNTKTTSKWINDQWVEVNNIVQEELS